MQENHLSLIKKQFNNSSFNNSIFSIETISTFVPLRIKIRMKNKHKFYTASLSLLTV